MLARLPNYIDPLHLADKRSVLQGRIPLTRFARLAELLSDTAGDVAVDLVFSREGKLAKIEGKIEGTLQLVCQNCLQAVEHPVATDIKLGVISAIAQIDRLPLGFEPLLLQEEKILLTDIVEDELLLILPEYPKHPYPCTTFNPGEIAADSPSPKPEVQRTNPFSILTNLTHPSTSENPHGSTKK